MKTQLSTTAPNRKFPVQYWESVNKSNRSALWRSDSALSLCKWINSVLWEVLLRDSSSSQLPKTPASRQQNVAAKIMTKSSSNSSKSSSKWRGWNNDSKWVKRRNERKGKTFQSATNQWKLLRITVNSKAHFPRWARLCWWSPFYFKVQVRKIHAVSDYKKRSYKKR